MADSLDYKELLKKYMRLIIDVEGSDYLACANAFGNVTLTEDEMKALSEISVEAFND